MSLFNFTTANTDRLVGGQNAFMSDIQGGLVDLKAFLNGGTIDETNVPNLSAAFTTWKDVQRFGGASLAAAGIGTYLLGPATFTLVNSAASSTSTFYLDPSDYLANARTTKYRIRWECLTNAVAPGVTITGGLSTVASFGGSSGNAPTVGTISAHISGSTAAFVSPGASTNNVTLSSEFNAPAAGNYVFAVVLSGALAAGSSIFVAAQLQMRQV